MNRYLKTITKDSKLLCFHEMYRNEITNDTVCIRRLTTSVSIRISNTDNELRTCSTYKQMVDKALFVWENYIPAGWLTRQVRLLGFVPIMLVVGIPPALYAIR